MTLKILPEIEENLFPLKPEELNLLEESILSEGVRDALVVWPKDGELILVDGHNRYRIAKEHNIPFEIKEKHFNDLDEVLEWVDFNQLGRRNLIDEQRSYVLGRLYERKKKKIGRPSGDGKGDKLSPFSGNHATAKEIAKQSGVNEKTVRRAADFAKAVDKVKEIDSEVANEVLKGNIKDAKTELPKLIKKNPQILNKVVDEIKTNKTKSIKESVSKIKTEERNNQSKLIRTLALNEEDKYKPVIYQGEFQDICKNFPDDFVDCIITDPPYPKEYLPLWSDLSLIAERILKPSGFCICYSGKYYLPEVIKRLSEHLEYYWQLILLHSGPMAAVHPVKINTGYKPILVFQKAPKKSQDKYITDIVAGTGKEKSLHKWQQSEDELTDLIDKFTNVDDLILDPFAGSGTVGVACKKNKRRSILIDINPIQSISSNL